MSVSVIFPVMVSVFAIVSCQQPLDDLSEISPYLPSGSLEKNLLQQCESFAQTLSEENERLKSEIEALRMKIQTMEDIEEEEDDDDEEEEEEEEGGSLESEEGLRPKGLRNRRGATCDGGTLAAWACAPQCVFKLKGLCGLSLKSICHC